MRYLKIVLILLPTLFIACSGNNGEALKETEEVSNDVKIETALVETQDTTATLNYSGLITPLVSTQLNFQIPGTVELINVNEGDKVRKGDVLAVLDNGSFISSHKAALAMKKQAEDAYNRLKTVYDKGSLPEIQWEDVKSKLQQASSAEQIARNNLKNCKITAPANGIIGSRNIEVGASVLPGITAINLVNINSVYVKISVPENEINRIEKGQLADVVVPAINRNKITGTVDKIGVLANPISKTYEVKIKIDNSELRIKPGMACDVDLLVNNNSNIITVPSQAVIKLSDNKNYVFLVDPNSNIIRKQEVTVGEFYNNSLCILSGLKKGDLIIISGQHKLSKNNI
jgi:RND family efflux transporter MFP subunit